MKKALWIMTLIPLLITAEAISLMPERVPMHYNAEGGIDRWGSRYEHLLFPVIIITMAIFWSLLVRSSEKKVAASADGKERAGAKTNTRVLLITALCMQGFMAVMQTLILIKSYRGAQAGISSLDIDELKIMCMMFGILFIIIGNIMPKTRPGSIGLRIKWSLYNDTAWQKSNRFAGAAMMITGLLVLVTSALSRSSFGAVAALLIYLTLSVIIMCGYSYKVYETELEKEENK